MKYMNQFKERHLQISRGDSLLGKKVPKYVFLKIYFSQIVPEFNDVSYISDCRLTQVCLEDGSSLISDFRKPMDHSS